MKSLYILLSFFFISFASSAQDEETLFDSPQRIGGFFSPFFEFGDTDGNFSTTFGGGGGILLNNFFAGGFGMGGKLGERTDNNYDYDMYVGYGGLWLGYTYPSHKLLHLYTSLRLGWGGLSVTEEDNVQFDNSMGIFVISPEAGVELNVAKWFRLAGTVGYRQMIHREEVTSAIFPTESELSSITFGLGLRFGWFGKKNNEEDAAPGE